MTFAPPTLTALGTYWSQQGGINLGIVGDAAHRAKGTSYHLGEPDLIAGAYSTQSPRDRAGLSEAASAIDLGKLHGSLGDLQAFSRWLVAQARTDAPGTGDMREIIYSPDGAVVLRWDRERGYSSAPRAGEADNGHLTHTHISWYRDAQNRDHRTAFYPYFAKGDTVGASFRIADHIAGTATIAGDGRQLLRVDSNARVDVPAGQQREVACGAVIDHETDPHFPVGMRCYLVGNIPGNSPDTSVAALLRAQDCTFAPAPVHVADSASYAITVGGKPAGSVVLP